MFQHSLKATALALGLWLVLALSPWIPEAAAFSTPCSNDQVTVIVEDSIGCASAGGNGYNVLIEAGFSVEGTAKFPDFICRINGFPSAEVDPCLTTSPEDAYWAYWKAPLDGSDWEYSNVGAFSDYPAAGTVVSWNWGAGERPGEIPTRQASVIEEETTEDPLANFDPNDLIIPELETTRQSATAQPTKSAANSATPTPYVNPNNPQEVVVYQDSTGNPISKEQYESLVAAAANNPASNPASPANPANPATSANAMAPAAVPTTSPTGAAASTMVMTAPGSPGSAAGQEAQSIPLAANKTDDSQAWMIGLSLAFTAVIGASAIGTWVIRRSEIQG